MHRNIYNRPPYRLAVVERCMGWKAKQRVAEGQMRRAIETFARRARMYTKASGMRSALGIARKEEILPYLTDLAACGWPEARGAAVLLARDYDVKSVVEAGDALKSIADFAREKGLEHESTLHIALHFIGETLERAAREMKFNPNHKPAGSPGGTGGEFDFAQGGGAEGGSRTKKPSNNMPKIGGRFGIGKIPKNPLLRTIVDSDGDGVEDTRPKNPMDPLGGPASPGRGNIDGLTAAEIQMLEQERTVIINMGKEHGRQFLKRPPDKQLTDHGNLRVNQRLPTQKEVDNAVSSSIKTGKITRKTGQYGTYQYHYEGENGLIVIVETEGRNAGKVITTFWKGTKGEVW